MRFHSFVPFFHVNVSVFETVTVLLLQTSKRSAAENRCDKLCQRFEIQTKSSRKGMG